MLAGSNNLNHVCAQKFLADVSDFRAHNFTWNAMTQENNLPIVASNTETTIGYFVYC
jgi:hypothetical protein